MKDRPEVEVNSIPDVLSSFGVGPSHTIAPIHRGIANHNYGVSAGGSEYVVKFLGTQAPETIENDLAIQRQLQRAGVGAPRYLRNRDGTCLYRGRNGIHAVISEKIDGLPPNHMSVELAADIGRHLALFHTSVEALPKPNDTGLMNPGVAPVHSEGARRLLQQPLPRGIIHGDLHGGNVLVDPLQPDRVVAILDFEEAGENLYLIDLAVTLMAVSSSPGGGSIEPELLRAAKRGYESVRQLTHEESLWLPQAIAYASEAWINWFRANGFGEYARQHQQRYDSYQDVFGADLL